MPSVRAERRTGELLRETSQNGQRATSAGGRPTKASTKARLSDHGISEDQSSDWQKLAGRIKDNAAANKLAARHKCGQSFGHFGLYVPGAAPWGAVGTSSTFPRHVRTL